MLDIIETPYGDLYIGENNDVYNSIGFFDTVSITVLKRNTTKGNEVLKAYIHDHSIPKVSNTFDIEHDGWYDVFHLIIPKGKPKTKDVVYFYDGELMEGNNKSSTPICVTDIIELEDIGSKALSFCKESVFILYNLWQCYFNYCKRILESECTKRSRCGSDCNTEEFKNMHLIWIFLNTIRYCVELGDMHKAQKLLEDITLGCNTLCSNEIFSKEYDCGCGK